VEGGKGAGDGMGGMDEGDGMGGMDGKDVIDAMDGEDVNGADGHYDGDYGDAIALRQCSVGY